MAVKAIVKNSYEALIVFTPGLSEKDLVEAVQQIESAIKNNGGTISKVDEPIRKRFTHKIKNFKDGYYISMYFDSPPEVPNILKRSLSISDNVLRYVLIRKEK